MLYRPAVLAFGLSVACQASMNTDARMNADLEGRANMKAEVDQDKSGNDNPLTDEERARALAMTQPPPVETVPLLGARRNLKVKSKDGAIACRCISVLLGPASMSQLEWEGEMPRTKPETQLVVALVPDSGECQGAPKGSRGASYWGYQVQGNDVVVLLEEWKQKPPQTLAAIIPKPPAGGQVYVSPILRSLPYGMPLDGKGRRCAVGNPGPQRATGLSDAEIGTSRPSSETEDVAE